MDRTKYQYEGLKWLFELEVLNHPQVINNIKLNILAVSPRIKEVELLIYRENKSLLVLLELSWLGNKLFKKQIFAEVQDVLVELLPTFKFRITDDPKIMNLAIEKVKRALSGGTYEKDNVTGNLDASKLSSSESFSRSNLSEDSSREPLQRDPASNAASSEEPTKASEDTRQKAGADDSKKE